MPAVPCTIRVESPLIAADRCSDSQLFAVPGSPTSISARSDARVAIATWMIARSPMYFGVIGTPPTGLSEPMTYVSTARGDSCQPVGLVASSAAARAASSSAYRRSAGMRISLTDVP